MRINGYGYKSIAASTGLSRDSVRYFCKSKGIDKNLNNKDFIKDGCLLCGKKIQQPIKGRKKKFYTEVCRRQWWVEHADDLERREEATYKITCKKCGREFESYGNKNRKYCSHSCYIKDRFYESEVQHEKGFF